MLLFFDGVGQLAHTPFVYLENLAFVFGDDFGEAFEHRVFFVYAVGVDDEESIG